MIAPPDQAPLLASASPQKVATRNASGEALLELGQSHPDVVVLDADLSGSTKTTAFGKAHPDRFFNIGVAEANMIGIAAGLASQGKVAFASSFAMFATGKAFEQIRQSVCVPELNVKVCATHAGLTVGEIAMISDLVQKMRKNGMTFLLVSHDLRALEPLVDRVIALNQGTLIADGSYADVMNDAGVRASYLGANDGVA